MSVDSAVAIGWDLLKRAVTAIKRPIRYVMSSKSFADGLQEEVQNLEVEVQRVNILAVQARNNVREFHGVFTTWEKKSDDALKEVRELLGNFENATKTCCHGTLPDPICRYQFSTKAKGKIEVIKQLAEECSRFTELNDISFINPTPGSVTALNPARREGKDVVQSTPSTASASSASTLNKPKDDDLFESRATIIRDITVALADDSISVVGIHGMGGVGKSTLLVDVKKRIEGEKQFDLIAKADVSQNPDIKMIQGVIAYALGLNMKDHEYESVRADHLRERLGKEKKKVLIILDDLWKELDLKSVGIPYGHDNKVMGCKLLLTSRDRNTLREKMGCDKDVRLDRLEEKEAKILFERMVGDKVNNDEFRPLVDEALRKCAGLPLLIVAMARHLKCAPLFKWKDALKQIEGATNEGISGVINKMLQLSYDHLESEDAKKLLQLCVAYDISYPSVENLMRYGYGLGIFQKDYSMEEARNRVSSLIYDLQASSLLLENGGVNSFKIHDLVRDFVARFILRDRPLLVLKNEDMLATHLQRERLESCTAICFPYIDMKELPKELDCPELRIFLLFNNNAFLEVQDSYFNSMRKLAVLDLTRIRLTRSPTPFQFLENLHTLCLQTCSLEDVAILGELKGLQILSFVDSTIERLPEEIGQLVELRLLDLRNCFNLQIIEPGVLGRLIKLEELYLTNSFNRWNSVEQTQPTNANLIELNNMKNLCTLHVSIPDPSVLPKDLNVKKLTKYRFRIGNGWHWSEYEGSRTLELELTPTSDVIQKGCIQSILSKTDNLLLEGLSGNEQSVCALSQEGFPELKHLQVHSSSSVHYIHISSSKSFSTLKVIRVERCDKIKVLFPLSLLKGLPQLEEIKVVGCKSMCGIVEADDCDKMELRNLHVLALHDLPNIKNFFTTGTTPSSSTFDDQVGTQIAFFNGHQVVFPRLETLFINGMDSIEIIWDNQVAANSFPKLNQLNVSRCDGLSSMISPKTAGNLVALTKLRVSNCRMFTEVISDEGSEEGHVVAFSHLKCMELHGLRRLRCFNSSRYTLTFPLLEDFTVSGCPNVKFFSEGRTEASKLKRVKVSTKAWFWKENLNITIHNLSKEMGVTFMQLSESPKLIEKWHSELNPIKSSWQLESLVVDKCPSFVNAIPFKLMLVLENLRTLQVRDCESLEEIFDVEGLETMESTKVLSSFTTLNLVNLPKLKRLWNKDLQGTLRFSSLRSLIIYKCNNLRHTFTLSMAWCLANLSCMEIKECDQMEGVIVEEEGQGSATEKITLSKLENLKLECLPNLTAFLLGKNCTMECLNLHQLTIDRCPRMKSLVRQSLMEIDHCAPSLFTPQVQFPILAAMALSHMDSLCKIWTDGPLETLTFEHLQYVKAWNCKSLENLFPHWVATSITQLNYLRVKSCMIEYIVASGDDISHSNTAQVLFPKLTSLVLHDMPRLKSFCPNLPTLSWPLLEDLRVTQCDKVNILSFVALMNNGTQRNDQQELSNQEAHSSLEKDFPMLERLSLVDKDISMIQDGKFPEDIFDKAEALTLACFHDEKATFPPIFLLEKFQNLQSLEILCSSFEEIFSDEGLVDEGKHPVLENLTKLKLNKLHNLKRVWREDSLVSKILRSIKTFEVWDCPCLRTILPVVTSFQNLTNLKVKNSSGLVHLITASTVTNLVHLKYMTIIGCERMKGVVANDGNEEGKVISFENLFRLTLQNLPSLEYFSSTMSCSLRFPSLWWIEVEECPKMKIFSKGTLSTPELGNVTLFRYSWNQQNWREMGDDLNTTIQKLSA
ncbi:hypothetical protein BT93_B1314 [Corymbia citriodora subsp. variegata]|nr:hypothetical protein BT93_B1314 [Corymbia citriodora subsp. variegata]